ncbi:MULTISPECIES: elongation factor P 5-aminopentanone reductase [unclassified Sporolactobacillus]|uniref:elongation factor P 5-aminopentanone reductase n=1 Tax=unclassified Sporolactobacillus TaxID=2628533 RepID=UPI00236869A6|nr:SDR family oxidoreductase [Sporolactobacillus sp. CQH2019]MDD9147008.1 SDR family oxidoreductase [Sporolactobacillus sp. CQH2019]
MHVGRTLITGASGAIGRATAKKLAAAGKSLFLHYNKGEEAAFRLAAELAENHPDQIFSCVRADLAKESGPDELLARLDGPVDAVVYNCGKSQVGLFQDVASETVKEFVQLQLVSPFRLLQQLIRPMIRGQRGNIVFVSSIWGLTGASTEVLYSMVKGGQNTLVKALAKELAPSGIPVNAVAPGAVDTPMMNDFNKEDIDLIKEAIPMGRLGRPEEIAALIAFLIGSDAAYISGQIISVNGAWYC